MNEERLNFPIAVVAYNRPGSLRRLLASLGAAEYSGSDDIPLIISIDYSGADDCYNVANDFEWRHGPKKVIQHERRLGLINHIYTCGDLAMDYGGVIVLEDDLFVSPAFYEYVCQSYQFYQGEPKVAGIALYSYAFNEFSNTAFMPLQDGHDNYFAQVPCSCGQFWTDKQWDRFRQFLLSESCGIRENDCLPDRVINRWAKNASWKAYFYKFLVYNNLYVVYPRMSLTTNFNDMGAHAVSFNTTFQVPLLFRGKNEYRFCRIDDSLAVYDYAMEPKQGILKHFNPEIRPFDFECDLNGIKRLKKVRTPYLLSIRETRNPVLSYDNCCTPAEANVINNIKGCFYHLANVESFDSEVLRDKRIARAFSEIKFSRSFIIEKVKGSITYRVGHFLLWPLLQLKKYLMRV